MKDRTFAHPDQPVADLTTSFSSVPTGSVIKYLDCEVLLARIEVECSLLSLSSASGCWLVPLE